MSASTVHAVLVRCRINHLNRIALPGWLHLYHSAIGGQPPITRLTNLPGHHT